GGSVCVGTTSNGSCAADPCGSLASTPAGVPVSTTTTSTTTTTQAQIQCCVQSSPMGAFDSCMLVSETQCAAQNGMNIGAGDCSSKPCPPSTTTTTGAATTTTTTRSSTTTTGAGSTTTTGTGMCPTTTTLGIPNCGS